MKNVLTLMLIGSFFAIVSCGPSTTSDQPVTEPEVYEQPAMEESTLEGDTVAVEIESDTTVVE